MKFSFVLVFAALLALLAVSEDTPFTGKKVVVVGGTGTIGYATALALAKSGANVTLVSRNQHPYRKKGEAAASAIAKNKDVVTAGGYAWFRKADARNAEELEAVFAEVGDDLDIVINAAGSLGFLGELSDCKKYLDDDEHNPLLTYLKATAVSTKTAADHMVAADHPGVIVNVGAYSETAKIGYNFYSPFFMAASRGVEAVTYAAAGKYVLKKVRVNEIELGAMEGPFIRNIAKFFAEEPKQPWEGPDIQEDDELWKNNTAKVIKKDIPIGKLATVQDIVDGIFYLADPETDYLSGAILRADGGFWAGASAF